MCEYTNGQICSITHESCPYVYYCDKKKIWLPSNAMPSNCKIKQKAPVPEGYYRVTEERKGFLYVVINDETYKLANPFDTIPNYVRIYKRNGQYHIKK